MNTLMKRINGTAPAATFNGMIDKLFQDNLNRIFDDEAWGFNGLSRSAGVPVNIRETGNSYELQLIAPGLKKEDFRVAVNNDMLTISFGQQEEHSGHNKQEGWLRREYQERSFSRSFSLNDAIDADKIDARYTDGILHLTLPKKEDKQRLSRTIEIK